MTAGPYHRVLVGWDGSPGAAAALSTAAALAAGTGGHVVALTVLRQAAHLEAAGEQDGAGSSARHRAQERFEQARRAVQAGCQVRISLQVIEDARVARALCGYAAEHGFDLLVLGRHGDGGSARQRLGRVAETAARCGEIPVLLLSPGVS